MGVSSIDRIWSGICVFLSYMLLPIIKNPFTRQRDGGVSPRNGQRPRLPPGDRPTCTTARRAAHRGVSATPQPTLAAPTSSTLPARAPPPPSSISTLRLHAAQPALPPHSTHSQLHAGRRHMPRACTALTLAAALATHTTHTPRPAPHEPRPDIARDWN